MSEIVGIHRQRYSHNIDLVKLDSGEILNIPQAVDYIKEGKLSGVTYAERNAGVYHLRSKRDDDMDNNLANLPEF